MADPGTVTVVVSSIQYELCVVALEAASLTAETAAIAIAEGTLAEGIIVSSAPITTAGGISGICYFAGAAVAVTVVGGIYFYWWLPREEAIAAEKAESRNLLLKNQKAIDAERAKNRDLRVMNSDRIMAEKNQKYGVDYEEEKKSSDLRNFSVFERLGLIQHMASIARKICGDKRK